MTAPEFNLLVANHGEFLQPYAVSLTRDPEAARDLCQETLLRALLNRDKYRFGTNLKAWLYTLMRNIFINRYHRDRRFRKTGTEALAELQAQAVNDGWGRLRMAEIRQKIDALPCVFRLAFELHYTGYQYQEIAGLLQVPLGTIKSRIHFARKMLVAQLDR